MEEREKKILDINLKFYESARAELIQRIILRDSALAIYIASVGTYMNHIIDMHYKTKIEDIDIVQSIVSMVPLPVVCLVFALIILQHHTVIGRIGGFLRHEITWGSVEGQVSRHWDNSFSLKHNAPSSAFQRLSAQAFVLVLPLIYNFIFFYRFRTAARKAQVFIPLLVVFIIDLIVILFIFWLHIRAHQSRHDQWKPQKYTASISKSNE